MLTRCLQVLTDAQVYFKDRSILTYTLNRTNIISTRHLEKKTTQILNTSSFDNLVLESFQLIFSTNSGWNNKI